MSAPITAAELRAFQTFAGYAPEELELLASILTPRELVSGGVVCRQGEEGRGCFILLSGAVEVERAVGELGVRRMGSLLPGAIFGQLSLIDGAPRLATCRAVGPVRVAELDRDLFLQLCQEGSRFAIAFQIEVARALTRQLRQSNQALSELEARDARAQESAGGLSDWLDALMTDPRSAL